MCHAGGAIPNTNERAVDFNYFSRCKRTRLRLDVRNASPRWICLMMKEAKGTWLPIVWTANTKGTSPNKQEKFLQLVVYFLCRHICTYVNFIYLSVK
jgi:hypothetical protein